MEEGWLSLLKWLPPPKLSEVGYFWGSHGRRPNTIGPTRPIASLPTGNIGGCPHQKRSWAKWWRYSTKLVEWLCASTLLSKVLRTRTTVGGPNTLGGSVTAGIRAKPISPDKIRVILLSSSPSPGKVRVILHLPISYRHK
jgi:hypothetical protein